MNRDYTSSHPEELTFLNFLIIDLKLQLTGREPAEPITMERLEEATKHLVKLEKCRVRVFFQD